MSTISPTIETHGKIRWNWIINKGQDLVWYIGSALAGWVYIAIVLAPRDATLSKIWRVNRDKQVRDNLKVE